MRRFLHFIAITFTGVVLSADLRANDIYDSPILYDTAEADNVVAKLQTQMEAHKVTLKPDEEHGYLKTVLKALDVPESSQILVFSKTSLQRSRIGPKTPRAIYFNDDVTIGYCHSGDVLEITASDTNLGVVFYTLSQNRSITPQFVRQTEGCLICHASSRNQGFPGHLARSVATDRRGELVLSRGTKTVNHSTPFEDRWGGWYVTGTSGNQTHQGNQVVGGWPWADKENPPLSENITDLKPYFTAANYLSPHSDLVALMVIEHQGEIKNRITRANFLTRQALHEQVELNKAFGEPLDNPRESITRRIRAACEPVVKYLLFSDEAKLTAPVAGTSNFTEEFAARGPFDSKKRSLRQFDLKTRMFRYPLSYVIYSKQFDGLPAVAKEQIYQRLWEVLSGQDSSKDFAHLTPEDRTAVLEILRETKPGLPDYWKK
ncbi:MAG: hypothetical protein LC104_12920 [Bacteroidales bacterium]|nr:hypothetical protein [Bacteroidales bacterium]